MGCACGEGRDGGGCRGEECGGTLFGKGVGRDTRFCPSVCTRPVRGGSGMYEVGKIRKSQEPVVFRADGRGWSIRASVDENSPPPHLLRGCPPLVVTTSPEGLRPPSRGAAPPDAPPDAPPKPPPKPSPSRRAPLVPLDHLILCNEIKSLETELDTARKQIVLQNQLIKGFCRMQAFGP